MFELFLWVDPFRLFSVSISVDILMVLLELGEYETIKNHP